MYFFFIVIDKFLFTSKFRFPWKTSFASAILFFISSILLSSHIISLPKQHHQLNFSWFPVVRKSNIGGESQNLKLKYVYFLNIFEETRESRMFDSSFLHYICIFFFNKRFSVEFKCLLN